MFRNQITGLILFLSILILLTRAPGEPVGVASAEGKGTATVLTPHPERADADTQPGQTDPQGAPETYMMFRDDELFYPQVYDTGFNWQLVNFVDFPDATLEITNSIRSGYEGTDWEIYAKRGRVTHQDRDQIIWVSREGSSGTVNVYATPQDFGEINYIGGFDGLAPRADGFSDFLGVAVGDLDKVTDSAGDNHDEIAVAYASAGANGGYDVNLNVLNFTVAGYVTGPVCQTNSTTSLGIDSLNGITPIDNILDVAIGDFDGDGMNEIAVTHFENANAVVVTTFRYTFDGASTCTLTQANATVDTIDAPSNVLGSLQTDAGDVDGDGVADLVVAYTLQDNANLQRVVPDLAIFNGNHDLNLQVLADQSLDVPATASPRVQVATALFRFDPGNGYDFNRRQILIGWASAEDTISMQAYDWDGSIHQFVSLADAASFSPFLTDERWSMTAGALKGVLAPQDPRWSAAFYGMPTSGEVASYFVFDVAEPQGTKRKDIASSAVPGAARLPIVAFDADGNSLFLGAPVRMSADDTVSTDYIIYEPPKHTFYNIDTSGRWGQEGQIVNVSRYQDFNVTLTENNTTSVSTSSTQSSDWTIGVSNESSASGTVKAGLDLGITAASEKTTLGMSTTVSYNYNYQNQFINSHYKSQSVTYSTSTDSDDSVGGKLQWLDIWRYRIYGLAAEQVSPFQAAYYDYVIPSKQINFQGNAGRDLDWYQPQHENGNLLSYPLASNGSYQPSDVGTLAISGTVMSGTLVSSSRITCCGNGGDEGLEFTGSVAQQHNISSSHTVNESVDFSAAYSAKVQILGNGGSISASTDIGFNNSNSWKNASTSNETTSVSKEVTLNYGKDGTGFGYFIYPVMHTTPDGTYKVSHAVTFLPNSQTAFWDEYYGQKPDPALNLPLRFYETTYLGNPTWAPKQDFSRKTIRGFYLLNGTRNPVTNQNDVLPQKAVSAGAPLLVQVNVYNYSTGGITNQTSTDANNLQVRFEYAPFDGTKETGARVKIGTITLPRVSPMQIVPAPIAWNTSGLGGTETCTTQAYRIIVTLDPNNTIDEIYENEVPTQNYPYVTVDPNGGIHKRLLPGIDPGQNNEGYAYVTVQTPDPNGNCAAGFDADVSLKKKSLGGLDAVSGKLRAEGIQAIVNAATQLRVRVYSDKPHGLFGHVLIFDGKPRKGGQLIADKLVHFGNPDGETVWFDWVPHVLGKHTLYARVVGHREDPDKKNGRDVLKVNVVSETR